ncbi:hypothetical protein ADK53_28640 [Streptomyces sp. WM6373]|uniref:hypothetical protein n=1 Tax=Streptomyces sp. WM6373 TaxID=1415556 RepID=UPI0006AEDFFC|nr:hypothetical protein [Streptomyces sp. WM6373]KOU30189.1 hypothetical protein ADK53_28640 [Streptomyces sp. WM6373]
MTVLCTARLDDSATARLHHCTLPARHDGWHRGQLVGDTTVMWTDPTPGAVPHRDEPELIACADQQHGWTCTLLDGPHPEHKHWDQEAGRWWQQASEAPYSNRDRLAAEAAP